MAENEGQTEGAAGGGRPWLWLAALGAVGAVAYLALLQPAAPPPEPAPAADAAPEPATTAAASPDASENEADTEAEAEAEAPDAEDSGSGETASTSDAAEGAQNAEAVEAPRAQFDVLRVEADGMTTIAGRAPAGGEIEVLLDGVVIARVSTGADGRFATLLSVSAADQPRTLSLALVMPDGSRTEAPETIIIAPIVPVEVAAEPAVPPSEEVAATPAPEATPEATAEAAPQTTPESGSETAPQAEAQAAPEPAPEPAPEVSAVLVTGDTARVIDAPDPAIDPAEVVIEAISYSDTGDVMLTGRGAAGQFVRLYVDGRALATVLVAEDGTWVASLRDIAPGIYTLRADQIDASGAVTARFETPFQREAPERVAAAAPAEATAAAPEDAAEPQVAVEVAGATDAPAEIAQAPEAVATAQVEAPAAPAPEPVTQAEAPAPQPAPAPDSTPAPAAPVSVTVQPGHSLWRIARERYGEGLLYVQVFEANRALIRDPDLIYPGQVFTLPAAE
jgi:nucleoid-associated protein YgaU